MRIIAGEFRRRRLLVNEGLTTRPITDRVKEFLFERIQDELDGCRLADLFAGTGSLGLEALSRGARSVVFVESDRKAFDLLRQNVASLGVEDRTMCWRTDVVKSSLRPKGVDAFLPYDAVFFDPPYRMLAELGERAPLGKALVRLARETVTAPSALLFIRAPRDTVLSVPSNWQPADLYAISSMEIHVLQKSAVAEPGPPT